MLQFDWTLHFGDVLQVLVIIGTAFWAYHGIVLKLALLTRTIEDHGETLHEHADRLQRYEASLFKLVGDLQRMIGRMETLDVPPSNHGGKW